MDGLNNYLGSNSVDFGQIEGHSGQVDLATNYLGEVVNKYNIKSVLEIGFNAGHSSNTLLNLNNDITVVSFDIGYHYYVPIAKRYIDMTYPNRHQLVLGDSTITVPEYTKTNPDKKFDLIFIDGGHMDDIPQKDLMNCQVFAHKNSILLFDDVKFNNIHDYNIKPNEAWTKAISSGIVEEIEVREFSHNHGSALGKYKII